MSVQNVAPSIARSPRYPRIPVLDALSHVRKLYNGTHRSFVDTDTAYRVLGFAGKNGASATVLGALRQFGLIEGFKGRVRVSELALTLLEPSSHDEYVEALHKAANEPEAFQAISKQFDGDIPRSDEAIRSFLIRAMNFSKGGADDCIAAFRETFSKLDREGVVVPHGDPPADALTPCPATDLDGPLQSDGSPVLKMTERNLDARGRQDAGEFVRIPLSKDCVAELRFLGPISDAGIARLIRYIDLMKDVWAEE